MRIIYVTTTATQEHAPSKRLVSLDAFRGLTIIGMLLVNNIALDTATPRHLMHAGWNDGVTFADMVFPWFLLIVGVAIPFSAASHRRKGLPTWMYDLKALQRAAVLVLLGCLINSSIAKTPMFSLGVLQLIGLAYFAGALLYDLSLTKRMVVAGLFLVGYWGAIRFLPVPGASAGAFTESTNLIKHLNEVYLQPYHLEGLLSVVPTTALVLIGSAIGDLFMRETPEPKRKAAYLAAGGAGLALIGWLWNLDLPFNKPVWTSSYILFAGGLGAVVLAAFYFLIDVKSWRAWSYPLVVFGVNAITAYVAPILVKLYILQEWTWTMPDGSHLPLQQAFLHSWKGWAGAVAGGWLYTASYIAFWWIVLLWMHRKKVWLRI